jgi:hypothetical protein
MTKSWSVEQIQSFCGAYLRTLDPQRAARAAGCGDGWAMLGSPGVRKRLERMRGSLSGQITREDAVRRLAELAFGRANDAAALALRAGRGDTRPEELELSAVSELRVTEKGVEVKFVDRIRALEVLCSLLGGTADGAEDFFRALDEAGAQT